MIAPADIRARVEALRGLLDGIESTLDELDTPGARLWVVRLQRQLDGLQLEAHRLRERTPELAIGRSIEERRYQPTGADLVVDELTAQWAELPSCDLAGGGS